MTTKERKFVSPLKQLVSGGTIKESLKRHQENSEKGVSGDIPENKTRKRYQTPNIPLSNERESTRYPPLKPAKDYDDIGVIQRIHKSIPVISDFNKADSSVFCNGNKFFVSTANIQVWGLHDRMKAGQPDIEDISISIRQEGQEEPCKVRWNQNDQFFELVAGFRRLCSVSQVTGMFLLCEVYSITEMPDTIAWSEMSRENNLERKKPVPISAQVEADEQALKLKLFKNRKELSLAAGKDENWSSSNLYLYNCLPVEIRNLATKEQLASLTSTEYRKLGKSFKVYLSKHQSLSSVIEVISEQLQDCIKFPVTKMLSIVNPKPIEDIKKLSSDRVKVKLDTNGNLSFSLSKSGKLSKNQVTNVIRLIEQQLDSLVDRK